MQNNLNTYESVQDQIRYQVEQGDTDSVEEQSSTLSRLLAMAWETRRPLTAAS